MVGLMTSESKLLALAATRLGVLLIALLAVVPAAQALDDRRCLSMVTETRLDGVIPGLAAPGTAPLTIVAIGSSSTEGHGTVHKPQTYPAVMEEALARAGEGADVRVVNKGKGGEGIPEMLARFERDVLALEPRLVIWQLGVNDVLIADGVEDRRAKIAEGLALLAANDIPVLLLDLQYAPRVLRDPDTVAMEEMIADSRARGRVFHFKRFAAMQRLAEVEKVPMSDMIEADGLHMTAAMHRCLGLLLADVIGSALPPQTTARR